MPQLATSQTIRLQIYLICSKLLPVEKAFAFMLGLLCDARKLAHVAYLRRDPVALGLYAHIDFNCSCSGAVWTMSGEKSCPST